MKKVLFTTIFILLLSLVGCDNNSETNTTIESVANIKNKKRTQITCEKCVLFHSAALITSLRHLRQLLLYTNQKIFSLIDSVSHFLHRLDPHR